MRVTGCRSRPIAPTGTTKCSLGLRNTRRREDGEAGTQRYGLLTVLRGGRIRLPGYRRDGRDPEYAWWTGLPYGSPVFLRALWYELCSQLRALTQPGSPLQSASLHRCTLCTYPLCNLCRPLQTIAFHCISLHFIASLQSLHAMVATMQRSGFPGASSLPLCQLADAVGKVLFGLNIIYYKRL